MADLFFPSCKARADYKKESIRLAGYVKARRQIDPVGCCRANYRKLTKDDAAIVVCNNCAAIIEENTEAKIEFVWKLIDDDPDFCFPDYHQEEITIQDCWTAFEKRDLQETVRSLLRKMNFRIVELEENFEKTTFCGAKLLTPCSESNAKLAHNRYVIHGSDMFTPMTPQQQKEYLERYCAQITTERVACYCKFCKDGICIGGRQGVHMLELLFPSEA